MAGARLLRERKNSEGRGLSDSSKSIRSPKGGLNRSPESPNTSTFTRSRDAILLLPGVNACSGMVGQPELGMEGKTFNFIG